MTPNTANLKSKREKRFHHMKNGCKWFQFRLKCLFQLSNLLQNWQKHRKSMDSARETVLPEQLHRHLQWLADHQLPASSRTHPSIPVPHSMHCPMIHPNCHSKPVTFLTKTGLPTKIHRLATTCQSRHSHFRILLRSFFLSCQNLYLYLCLSFPSACPYL